MFSIADTLRRRPEHTQQLEGLRSQLRVLRDEFSHQTAMCNNLEAGAARVPEVEVLRLLKTQQSLHANWEEKLTALHAALRQLQAERYCQLVHTMHVCACTLAHVIFSHLRM